MFVIFRTFPCTTTVFPWFPGFSLVQLMLGSGRPDTSQVNCKLWPSRTFGLPLIPVIFIGTKSNQTITSKSRIIEWHVHTKATIAKKMILLTWFLYILCAPCTCKWNSNAMIVQIIQEQSLHYDPLRALYYAQMSALRNLEDFQKATKLFWILFSA